MKNILLIAAISILLASFSCTKYDSGAPYTGYYPESYSGDNFHEYDENPFILVTEEDVSTFSVDADGGSYTIMRRYLNDGQNAPKASVRIEEYINFFTFDYTEPTGGHNVSLESELSTCPWNTEHYLMRIGMKGKTIPEGELPYSNYVFLIDVSGSMNSTDKLDLLKTGFKTMVDNLRDFDRVAIVTYAGSSAVLLQSTPATQKNLIKDAIDQLGAGGSTAGAEGIETAYEIALENYIDRGNNRIIIGTDGDFNVGPSNTDTLIALIEEMRESGVYLTVLGVGSGNLNDHMLEQIANNGNGNYEFIDNVDQIEKIFTHELAKFYTVAKDSKIQITFDSTVVHSYRLIGYENRLLENEDFENDTVDAGEIGSGQTITAIYELVLQPNQTNAEYAQFDFRYKLPNASQSRLITHYINGTATNIADASENMRFSAAVVGFGLMMRESQYAGTVSKQMVLQLGNNATTFDPHGYRSEFLQLVNNWTP